MLNKNSKSIGDVSEAEIMAALLRSGRVVLRPWGDNQRYDLAIDDGGGRISRIQVKTGRYVNGAVYCETTSFSTRGASKYLSTEIEFMGIYCPQLKRSYLVSIDIIGSKNCISLRIEPSKNGQKKKVLWAKDFEIPG